MAEDNRVLEQLRLIRFDLRDLKETQAEHGVRLNRIESGIAGIRRDQALDAENVAHHSVRIDQIIERVARIEQRLELRDET